MPFHKWLWLKGAARRNPSLLKSYNFLQLSDKWSLEELQNYQLQKLKEFLVFADEYSPFYQKLFSGSGFIPSKLSSFDDLKKIPPVSKEQLIKENEAIHTRYSFLHLFNCETSGTSGQVLTFKRNEEWDSMNRAAVWRGYNWHGVEPWEKNLYFWGYNINPADRWKVRLMDWLQNRYRIFNYSPESLKSLAHSLRDTVYIHGYSSMIYETAKALVESGIELDKNKVKMIKGTSEKIYPHYQDVVQKAFGRKIISEYGAAEAGIIAFECEQDNMHLNMQGCYIEQDENNEVLVTNFLSYSFPIIRYRLGDVISLAGDNEICSCGRKHRILKEVTGRVGKNIYGYSNKYPSLTLYYIFKNLYFTHDIKCSYQAIQEEKGKLLIRIKEPLSEHDRNLLKKEIEKYYGNDIAYTVRANEEIHSYDKKLKDFISFID